MLSSVPINKSNEIIHWCVQLHLIIFNYILSVLRLHRIRRNQRIKPTVNIRKKSSNKDVWSSTQTNTDMLQIFFFQHLDFLLNTFNLHSNVDDSQKTRQNQLYLLSVLLICWPAGHQLILVFWFLKRRNWTFSDVLWHLKWLKELNVVLEILFLKKSFDCLFFFQSRNLEWILQIKVKIKNKSKKWSETQQMLFFLCYYLMIIIIMV